MTTKNHILKLAVVSHDLSPFQEFQEQCEIRAVTFAEGDAGLTAVLLQKELTLQWADVVLLDLRDKKRVPGAVAYVFGAARAAVEGQIDALFLLSDGTANLNVDSLATLGDRWEAERWRELNHGGTVVQFKDPSELVNALQRFAKSWYSGH